MRQETKRPVGRPNAGRILVDRYGYRHVWLPQHPRAKKGRVREHRLSYERYLKRHCPDSDLLEETSKGQKLLRRDIEIHHKNGNKGDNRIENLQAMTVSEHRSHHSKGNKYRLGIPMSEEFKEKLRKAHTGRKASPETVAKRTKFKPGAEVIRALYYEEKKTIQEIADMFGVQFATVQRAMRRYGIKSLHTQFEIDRDTLYDLYVTQGHSLPEIGRMYERCSNSIRNACMRLGIPLRSASDGRKTVMRRRARQAA